MIEGVNIYNWSGLFYLCSICVLTMLVDLCIQLCDESEWSSISVAKRALEKVAWRATIKS